MAKIRSVKVSETDYDFKNQPLLTTHVYLLERRTQTVGQKLVVFISHKEALAVDPDGQLSWGTIEYFQREANFRVLQDITKNVIIEYSEKGV